MRLGLKWLAIDGSQSIEALMAQVEAHFAPYLKAARP
jgi:hypothetical protein